MRTLKVYRAVAVLLILFALVVAWSITHGPAAHAQPISGTEPAVNIGYGSGPPAQATMTVLATDGLSMVIVTRSTNADTVVPPITAGMTASVDVTSTLIDQTQPGLVTLIIYDIDGDVTTVNVSFNAIGAMLLIANDVGLPTDPNQAGAVVNYPAPMTSGTVGTVTCSPPSGSFFPIGMTTVTCMSSSGLSDSFQLRIVDNQPPSITPPANVTVDGAGPGGAVVTYPAPTVTDNTPGATVACFPPSGSTFPVGTTTVVCVATDANGSTASASFTVTVNRSIDWLARLRSDTINLVSNTSAERVLVATIDQAQQAESHGNSWGVYTAMLKYVLQIDRYVDSRSVSPAAAQQLIAEARMVVSSIL